MYVQEYKHCYKCGLPLDETQPTVISDGKVFHNSCTITLQCYDCRKVIAYQAKDDISSDRIVTCVECASRNKES